MSNRSTLTGLKPVHPVVEERPALPLPLRAESRSVLDASELWGAVAVTQPEYVRGARLCERPVLAHHRTEIDTVNHTMSMRNILNAWNGEQVHPRVRFRQVGAPWRIGETQVPDMSQPAPFPVHDAPHLALMEIHSIAKIDA